MSEMSEEYEAKAMKEQASKGITPRLVKVYHEGCHEGKLKIFHLLELAPSPIFHDWSFETDIEYDSSVISARQLRQILKDHGMRRGFGDWRPRFGQAKIELTYKGLSH